MNEKERICQVMRLGQMDYQEAWDLQECLIEDIVMGARPATLLVLEHPHTFTFGRRGRMEHLLWSPEELELHKVNVFWVDRGGDVTYHGPGQLVCYPLIQLAPAGWHKPNDECLSQVDCVGYLRKLEQVVITALAELGLPGCRALNGLTGVWAPEGEPDQRPAKIASIGVKVDAHGITRHGFALNVEPDMSYWQGIIGCGLEGTPMTSMAELLPMELDMRAVERIVVSAFGREFGYRMVEGVGLENCFSV